MRTFVLGNDPAMTQCALDSKHLFAKVKEQWQAQGLTGRALYDYAAAEADRMGWELNLDISGLRLADFPHAAHYDGPLSEVDFPPSPLAWVLEIHIRDKQRRFARPDRSRGQSTKFRASDAIGAHETCSAVRAFLRKKGLVSITEASDSRAHKLLVKAA
ncbi:hypothetical protein [Caballeronia sp. dw_19]|uniref:hypothetical protein n=1 Tax=Caballeronia sp. dw_19 TaxID=2719791 RepID=UPI001BD5BCE8|nr:hypothetical protein [Caballeronia sp. dw_19]